MVPNREQIYTGLLSFLENAIGAQTVTRIPVPEAEITTAQMPMIEQLPSSENAVEQGLNLPVKWLIRQPITVYVDTSSPDVSPDTAINNILDAIEKSLAPSPYTGYQTLNGLVVSCRFKGVIVKDPGYQTTRGAALVAIELLTTS